MAVLTNTDYWGEGAVNCGARWMEASPGDVLLAHDEPSARRAARLLGCKLVEVVTGPDGAQLVSGPNGQFLLRGSFPVGLPEVGPDALFACDVAVFGPPDDQVRGRLDELSDAGLRVRIYDRRPWASPSLVGGLQAPLDILTALASAGVVIAASEDLEMTAWAVGGRAVSYRRAGEVESVLEMDEEDATEIRFKTIAFHSRSARLADVLGVSG